MADVTEENKENFVQKQQTSSAFKESNEMQKQMETDATEHSYNSSTHAMTSYVNQWKVIFDDPAKNGKLLNHLRSRAFEEGLRSCHFRSVCWRVFLECLSEDISKWRKEVTVCRENYNTIKERHVIIPQSNIQAKDLELENPLSQSDKSCWSQFFKNNDLKSLIDRDVRRTSSIKSFMLAQKLAVMVDEASLFIAQGVLYASCPEMNFFHSDKIREMMKDILFCYAREHEKLSYRQGMHELLAPLIFVLHCDLQGAAHAKDMGALPIVIDTVLKEEYLEHDAYEMFCQVMDATNLWYSLSEHTKAEGEAFEKSDKLHVQAAPFQPAEENADNSPPLAITNKLNRIHDKLLANYDVELYQHLNRLEIIPQVYGLRWVRLLFGREFDIQDLLVLWDALFADSKTLDLVDYIFVAMMFNIRHQLLKGEYCTCMRLLMKYPPIEDIYDLVRLAIYYRDPENHQPPPQMRLKPATSQSNTNLPTNDQNSNKKKILPSFKMDNPFSNFSLNFKKKSVPSLPSKPKKQSQTSLPSNAAIQQLASASKPKVQERMLPPSRVNRERSLSGLVSVKSKKEEIHNYEVAALKQQVSELQEKCQFCSDKIDASIRLLQPYFMDRTTETSATEDYSTLCENGHTEPTRIKNEEPLVALANLKQVRDMLRGSLNMTEMKSSKPESLSNQLDSLPDPPQHLPEESKKSIERTPIHQNISAGSPNSQDSGFP